MKKNKWILIIAVIALACLGYVYFKPNVTVKNLNYTYTHSLQKGNIEASVSSTGTVEAINTVEVGTQISGTISKIYVDYNDKVTKGQLLAEMDMRLLNASLQSSRANLAVSETQLEEAEGEFKRDKTLFEKKVISEQEYLNTKYAYERAISNKKVSQSNLTNSQVNIGYAKITSPINGIVIEKTVDEGQTVAASFSTPTMFIIAEDLSQMQILADVDESDIGYIKDKMLARFTVQTFTEDAFYGTVSQIRLQPIKINNVVNYQVVVDIENKEGKLIPGMTASLEFITESEKDVWIINNAALRFRPNQLMLNELKPLLKEKTSDLPETVQKYFIETINNEELFTPERFKEGLPSNINGFFYESENGDLDFKFIEIGIRIGLQSEVKGFLDGSDVSSIKPINGIKLKE